MKVSGTKVLSRLLPIISILCVLLLWAVSALIVNKQYLLPGVSDTFCAVVGLFGEARFYYALSGTLLRTVTAFALSFSFGFLTAVLAVKSRTINGVISPIIGILRALPTVAVILLLLVWTDSKTAPVIVTMLVVLPTSYSHLKSAFDSLDKTVSEAARVDGATETEVLRYIEIPLVSPVIFAAVGGGFSLNFKLMVAAEVISATARSIGSMLSGASYNFETAEMIALVVVSVAIGLAVESVFNLFSAKAREKI